MLKKNKTIKASDTLEHQSTVWPVPYGYAMLVRPGKAKTAVHGCHCLGDMAVCMSTWREGALANRATHLTELYVSLENSL